MTMTNTQLQQRISEIEQILTTILEKMQGVASRVEITRLVATRQSALNDHEERIAALETRLSNLTLSQQ